MSASHAGPISSLLPKLFFLTSHRRDEAIDIHYLKNGPVESNDSRMENMKHT
jgi:hypothetical protein